MKSISKFIVAADVTGGVSQATAVFLTALIAALSVAAIVFLYLGIRRERNRFIADKLKLSQMDEAAFLKMLERRFRIAKSDTHFLVMFVELLNGDALRESLGVKQYDAVMTEIYERLYAILPKGTKIGPYRENISVVFIDEDLDTKGLSDLAAFCVAECSKPIALVTRTTATPELCAGAAAFEYKQNLSALQFCEKAEAALTSARRAESTKWAVYTSELDYESDETYRLFRDIRRSAAAKEYTLDYRPVVDTTSGGVFAYEGVLRWYGEGADQTDVKKIVSVLDQTGEIHRVGLVCFEALCAAVQQFKRRESQATTGFSFPLSVAQATSPTLPEELYRIVRKYSVPAGDICIVMPELDAAAIKNVHKLSTYGFKTGVCIVGTDENSAQLSELQNLPISWIKLPAPYLVQSRENFFIRGAIDTLVRFSQNSGISVIAYGVDDEETANCIKEMQITYAEGEIYATVKDL